MELTHARLSFVVALIALLLYSFNVKDTKLTVDHINSTYDYIIVGGSSAGCLLAARLSEDSNNRVLLLEAGGEETGNDNIQIPAAALGLWKSQWDWAYLTTPQKNSGFASEGDDNRHLWSRGKVLGGSSSINMMQYVRGSRYDYDEWNEEGCDGWGYDDVLPYFLKSEDIRIDNLNDSRYHNSGGPLVVTKDNFISIWKRFVDAGKELGYKEIDYNGEDQIGFGGSQVNIKDLLRGSTVVQFLRPAMYRTNLHVGVDAQVTKVLIEGKIARGVPFVKNNKKQTVYAEREVILSAGAIGSPQILMLSGVGPRAHLEGLNIPVVIYLPVGQNMEDHVYTFTPATMNSLEGYTGPKSESISSMAKYLLFGTGPLTMSGDVETAFIKSSKCKTKYPDTQFHLFATLPLLEMGHYSPTRGAGILPDKWTDGFLIINLILHPRSTGFVMLESDDPFDYPVIDSNYFENEEDIQQMIEIMRKGLQLL